MKRLEEQDIRGLLETPPAAPPPEDLADRLKAQIPDPLPQWDEDEAAAPSPDSAPRALRGPWLQKPWLPKPWRTAGRLAAALVAMIGVGALSLQVLQWSTSSLESSAAFDVADQGSRAKASPEAMVHDDLLSEGSMPDDAMSDDVLSESMSAEAIPGADVSAPDLSAPDPSAPDTLAFAPELDLPAPVASESRRITERSGSPAAESAAAESAAAESANISTALPAPRAKRVEVPSPRAQTDVSLDAVSARVRRGPDSARESMALRMAEEIEAKRLEGVDVSLPWTLTEAAPRMEWQPSVIDATALEVWRRDPASQDPTLDAALMTFGALSTPRGEAKGLRLDLAPAPSAVLGDTFWLLAEIGSPGLDAGSAEEALSPRLQIEFLSNTVARYQLLAGGFDREAQVGRLLLAVQLTSSQAPSADDVSADDVVVRVRQLSQATSHTVSQDAVAQEETLRRRDVVSNWHEATWPYRVQTLGVELVRALGSSSEAPEGLGADALLRKAEGLAAELRQRPASGADDPQLESWLDWLVSTSQSKD